MLILTRQVGEKIVIGDKATVRIVNVRKGQVRLGVEAEKSQSVHRKEVYDRIKRDKTDQ